MHKRRPHSEHTLDQAVPHVKRTSTWQGQSYALTPSRSCQQQVHTSHASSPRPVAATLRHLCTDDSSTPSLTEVDDAHTRARQGLPFMVHLARPQPRQARPIAPRCTPRKLIRFQCSVPVGVVGRCVSIRLELEGLPPAVRREHATTQEDNCS